MDLRAAVCALASLLAPPLAAGPADSGLVARATTVPAIYPDSLPASPVSPA